MKTISNLKTSSCIVATASVINFNGEKATLLKLFNGKRMDDALIKILKA